MVYQKKIRILAWAFYDFANTIFSAVVLTSYFPLYLNERAQGKLWYLGLATTGSMLLAGAAVPLLGALSDRTGKTKTYLIRTTLLCLLFLIGLSIFNSIGLLMASFVISCFFYHASLVFYHALLPAVAKPEEQGKISGLGTGLGYLGVVIALPIVHEVEKIGGKPLVFTAAASLFLLFSLPVFLWVPERRVQTPEPFRWHLWTEEWRKAFGVFTEIQKSKTLWSFFAGNFLVLEALNATIFWFAVYAKETFNPGSGKIIQLLLGVNASAFAMGLLCGWLTDKFTSKRILAVSAFSLAVTVSVLALTPDFQSFFWVCCAGGSFAIAGIWTAGRKRVLELAPPEKLGTYCGFYNLTTKISVVSNLIFSVIAGYFNFKTALLFLAIPAIAGAVLLKNGSQKSEVGGLTSDF